MLRVMARFIEKNKALARNEKNQEIDSIDISSFGQSKTSPNKKGINVDEINCKELF